MDLESVAGELYALHPTQFVGARTARVDDALAGGKAVLAAQVAALRRPTQSAWASNLLVRCEPKQVARLLRLGVGLHQAHQTLSLRQPDVAGQRAGVAGAPGARAGRGQQSAE